MGLRSLSPPLELIYFGAVFTQTCIDLTVFTPDDTVTKKRFA